MKTILKALLFLFIYPSAHAGLVDNAYIGEHLTKQGFWAGLHGAKGENLGAGMLYYGIVYAMRAKTCVCLGSGDGFVPRVLRQAQRDLGLEDSRTILIDGNTGKWGHPQWLSENSILKREFPEIEIFLMTTKEALEVAKNWKIDYLHIDADRTVRGALQDFLDYLPCMTENGIIILHDTGSRSPCGAVVAKIQALGYSVINFPNLGTGFALIKIGSVTE
ncbi:MAG: class I SAM-dependent methyltransferase [Chlamydiota bacterium]